MDIRMTHADLQISLAMCLLLFSFFFPVSAEMWMLKMVHLKMVYPKNMAPDFIVCQTVNHQSVLDHSLILRSRSEKLCLLQCETLLHHFCTSV